MEFASPYLKYVWTSWRDGGWIMIALVLLAFIIHVVAIRMIQVIRCYRDVHTIENLESFLRTPGKAPPALRSLFAYLSPHPNESIDLPSRVYEVQPAIVSPLNQNKMLLAVLVSTAPLLGLLGTVMGMLERKRSFIEHSPSRRAMTSSTSSPSSLYSPSNSSPGSSPRQPLS